MSTNHGRHLLKPHILQSSAKKTVYPLPQQLAEKVIKDKGRNAYVVVFDTTETKDNPGCSSELVTHKRALKTSSRVFNEQNVALGGDEQEVFSKKQDTKEDVKINFSNLAFEEYDSSKTAVNVFKDDDLDGDTVKCGIKQEIDEGFGESNSKLLSQQIRKTSEPIAGYMLITPQSDSVQFYKPSTSTPPSKYDLSGSSGYFSGSSSGVLSEFNTPSPISTTDQGFCHPAARQIILVPSPLNYDGRPQLHYPNISPMSSLATGLQNIARIQSPTVFSTKKFTGADAFSLPEESLRNSDNSLPKENFTESTPSTSSTNSAMRNAATTQPFKWEQVENRIVIQAPNKKPLDLTLPNVNTLKESTAQKSSNKTTGNIISESRHDIGDVVIHCNVKQKETVVMVQQGNSGNYAIGHLPVSSSQETTTHIRRKSGSSTCSSISKLEADDVVISHDSNGFSNSQESFGVASSQESNESSVGTDKECLDTSLTNIQWLGGIQLKNASKTEKDPAKPPHNSTPIQWKRMSTDDILRIAAECGRCKRPPFSYMTLIQMALHSKEDKRMRLRDICAWIENTFPYYKHTAKPGWRNSIRHNLSLYSIFERETTKKHGSYWTVRDDCPEKLKSCPGRDAKKDEFNKTDTSSPFQGVIPVIPSFLPQATNTASTTCTTGPTQSRKRVGPQPILPRPSPVGSGPLQTYALIPIQNVGNSSSQSPNVVMPMSSSQESSSAASECSQHDSQKGMKERKIAPKLSPSLMMSPPNIVKQAWLDSQFVSSSEGEGEKMKGRCENNRSDSESCPKKAKTGLPQPKLYSKNTQPVRRTKSRRKQKLIPKERELMQDSSDEESEYAKFVSRLEKDLPTPMRKMLDEDNVKNNETSAITSTPLKKISGNLPEMLSPFSGLTPLKTENILDNSFLECLRDSPQLTAKKSPSSSGSSPKLDLNFIGLTPIKVSNGSLIHDNSYNLSRFLAEYPIDANMMDEADVLPVDLSALNWSNVQNMVQLDNS